MGRASNKSHSWHTLSLRLETLLEWVDSVGQAVMSSVSKGLVNCVFPEWCRGCCVLVKLYSALWLRSYLYCEHYHVLCVAMIALG